MSKEEECVSSSSAWPFYTHPVRHPYGQAEARSAALGATSTFLGQQPFRQLVPRGFGDAGTQPSSALATTSLGLQPSSHHVDPREGAQDVEEPSPSLSCKRRGHAPLITRPGLHHQTSWTRHLTHPARRVSVSLLSCTTTSLLSYPTRSPSSWPPSREWEGPCVSSFFLSLVP